MRAAFVLLFALVVTEASAACKGCGCRGGPGYRGPSGRCVGLADIGRTCGSPPTTRCSAEGPNAGAEEEAEHQESSPRARSRRSGSF